MYKYYAQIDENNVVYCISQLSGEIDNERCIEIESYDTTLDYAIYNPVEKTFTRRQKLIPPTSPWIEDEVKTLKEELKQTKEELKQTQDTLDFLLLG